MFGIAIDTWGHCRHLRLESLQEVMGTIDAQGHWESMGLGVTAGQCYCENSKPQRILMVTVDS